MSPAAIIKDEMILPLPPWASNTIFYTLPHLHRWPSEDVNLLVELYRSDPGLSLDQKSKACFMHRNDPVKHPKQTSESLECSCFVQEEDFRHLQDDQSNTKGMFFLFFSFQSLQPALTITLSVITFIHNLYSFWIFDFEMVWATSHCMDTPMG